MVIANLSDFNARNNNPSIISIEGLKKSFDKNQVLHNVNLDIHKGENIVVLGKSGTGKSVLIKCIIGLIRPDEGKITIFGKDISLLEPYEMNNLRRRIGFLFQSGALYDSMTARENLEFPLRNIDSLTKKEIQERVIEVLENVGLSDAVNKMPSELSGGMRKRLGLARTLILKPQIMLYDEPTTGLDAVTAKEISLLILKMQKKYNITSVIITHDLACAKITANRIAVLRNGEFIAEGSFNELEKHPDDWIRAFFD